MPIYELAWLSEISEHLLEHYEQGKREIRLNELLRIACTLEVGIEKLLTSGYKEKARQEYRNDFIELCDKLSKTARRNGMTEEILKSILAEKK